MPTSSYVHNQVCEKPTQRNHAERFRRIRTIATDRYSRICLKIEVTVAVMDKTNSTEYTAIPPTAYPITVHTEEYQPAARPNPPGFPRFFPKLPSPAYVHPSKPITKTLNFVKCYLITSLDTFSVDL